VTILDDDDLKRMINKLLAEQRLAVLSSYMDDQPYPNLIAFVHTNDLKNIFFATLRSTKKYENIKNNPYVSMLIDNRGNSPSDFTEAIAVSIFGTVAENDFKDNECINIYLKKHPYLKDFLNIPDCALLKIKIDKFKVVSDFQKVNTILVE
jgi:general stress protein 26